MNAQNALNARAEALRKQKKNVLETGWTEPAALAAAPAAAPPVPAAKQATTSAAGASAGGSGGGSGGSSELSTILAAVFGSGGGGGSAATAGGAAHTKGSAGTSGNTADQGGAAQVASTLATVFSAKPSAGSDAGGPSAPSTKASEGLGSAEAQNTKLVVYGCGRQDAQVACVTELTNQNQKETLVQSTSIWKDTFIVDDRGDRHQRSNGFFLNIDGDQRSELDISYGKAARFILMFDGVPAKVQKVALRNTTRALNVEDINLVAPGTDAPKH